MKRKPIDPNNLPADVCEHLLNKNILCYEHLQERVPELAYPGDADRGSSYWCALSQDPQGPDGEIVDPRYCRAGRSCCVSRAVPRSQA